MPAGGRAWLLHFVGKLVGNIFDDYQKMDSDNCTTVRNNKTSNYINHELTPSMKCSYSTKANDRHLLYQTYNVT